MKDIKNIKEYFINSCGKGRVFISQPMNGKTTDEIRFEREDIVDDLTNKGYVVADSILRDTPPEDNNAGLWCLGESLKILAGCDYAYFIDGWQKARGCKIEHECAEKYGIKIIKD